MNLQEQLKRAREALADLQSRYLECPYCDSDWDEHMLGYDCPYKVLFNILSQERKTREAPRCTTDDALMDGDH
jgi:C4-type Zn-finger protein